MKRFSAAALRRQRRQQLPPRQELPEGYMLSLAPNYPHPVKIKDVERVHREMMDQFDRLTRGQRDWENYRP